jgi:hypothetical protein
LYAGKEDMRNSSGGSYNQEPLSAFQRGRRVTFMNAVPIAAGCYLRPEVVKSGLDAIFRAMYNLVSRNYDLEIDMKFCIIRLVNRELKVVFKPSLKSSAQGFMDSKPKTKVPVSKAWKTHHLNGVMMNYVQRPNTQETIQKRSLAAQLGKISLDLNSSSKAIHINGSRPHGHSSSAVSEGHTHN